MRLRFDPCVFSPGRHSGGRNIHVLLADEETGQQWFGKFSCPNGRVRDAVDRELAISALTQLVGFCAVPEVCSAVTQEVVNLDDLKEALIALGCKDHGLREIRWNSTDWAQQIGDIEGADDWTRVPPWDRIALATYICGAVTIRNWSGRPDRLANLCESLQGLAFNLWVGNYEGNCDLNVIIDTGNRAWFLDFGNAGPGDTCDLAKNVNGSSFDTIGTLDRWLPSALREYLVALGRDRAWEILRPLVEKTAEVTEADILDALEAKGAHLLPTDSCPAGQMNCLFAQEMCRRASLLKDRLLGLLTSATNLQ